MTLDREKYFFTPRYTRGQVCKVFGITKDTLRHYEECSLIKPYENKKNKYKYYSIADLEILSVILFLRSIDIPIIEIPKFIECRDINEYGNFLDAQINEAINKINYWNNIKEILCYLKNTVDDYKNLSHKVRILEDITFKFKVAQFDYQNYDIEKMVPDVVSNLSLSHIIKLKIIDNSWILSNREDTTHMIVGSLCKNVQNVEKDICIHKLPVALMLTTLEPLEKIPKIITEFRESYKGDYEFEEKTYIVEHTFFNIFNQDALIRNIYLPIVAKK
ncbi:MerR HTH family regulatory protein [Clostridium collagenovorans DSM 3089]|uniref:MerR HTH family regulatory protein n=1 Tax=Clostridium collagenovorans DSM 3089 TaxID=1121306 RepID=A0A1M5Y477_9CLOT|nr:MerR family transcriptional regulator [Clostridium collagenovorans]SHI06812.1 MerR HTH family regulatory protein [Clostridium collagenovorans DSM 3089]